VWEGEHAPAADAAGGIPLPAAQNHKLAYPFFPLASQVLVVRSPAAPAAPLPFLPGDTALCADISRGREAQPIALFNSADDEPAPVFTYVTQCVVSESLRLLVGGPQLGAWLCPRLRGGGGGGEPNYDQHGRLRFAPHTVESIWECCLESMCRPGCDNRLVQYGPRFRLEVFRCPPVGRISKGWGIRSPELIPRGSFVCEYVGEYISDDEAESRGIRYDNQKMSRLMDVYGNGRDAVHMCIDATKFSNVGRFLNHSCEPNVFKQRVFCDHHVRLPRIAFFALVDIPPRVELCYDYGYVDVPGKTMPCLCGAKSCKKLLY